jgi:NAD+ kinase
MSISPYIKSDNNKKSEKIKFLIKKKIDTFNLKKSNLIIVIGGDGFMLNILKKYQKYNLPFYGINSGNFGFLMNKFSEKKIIENIMKSKKIIISPIQMIVKSANKSVTRSIAINEVSILRQSKQTASLSVYNKKRKIIKKLVSDGILISTPAGSTAYNLSVHGPILSLDSKKLAVTPISPFRPRRWKGQIVKESSEIIIKNLDPKKRPVSAVADSFEIRNATLIKIKIDKKAKFSLMFNKHYSLNKKIKIEQLKNDI